MCLLGATHNIWCSMASAAVVGATVFRAAAVGSLVVGAAKVGAGAEWCAVHMVQYKKKSISIEVVGVMI